MVDRMRAREEWRIEQEKRALDDTLRGIAQRAKERRKRALEKMCPTLVAVSVGPGYIRLHIRELTDKIRQQIITFESNIAGWCKDHRVLQIQVRVRIEGEDEDIPRTMF